MTFAKNKYRGSERDTYYEDLEEKLKNRNNSEDTEDTENTGDEESNSSNPDDKNKNNKDDENDNTDWKKRYADLQRHLSSLEKKWEKTEKDLQAKVEAAESKASLPDNLTPEKIEEWEKKFPDVAAIIDRRAKAIAESTAANLEEEVGNLKKSNMQMEQERAILQLISIHEDFIEVRDSDEFQNWIEDQPKWMGDAIYNPEDFSQESVDAAARVVRFFKLDTGWGENKKPSKKKKQDTSAAETVSRSGSNLPDDVDGQPEFSESQVAKMSSTEFEKSKDKILASQRSGRFLYDLTGAAR